jgi:ABC-type Fe3+/spermidine/putrescine transport system ATPase subunit
MRITGSEQMFSVRPEKIHFGSLKDKPEKDMVSMDGVVRDVVYLGLFTRYLVEIEGGGRSGGRRTEPEDHLDGCVIRQRTKGPVAWHKDHISRVGG